MQSDGDDEPEEAEDLASSADLSFDEIRSVLNKPEKQVRMQHAGSACCVDAALLFGAAG